MRLGKISGSPSLEIVNLVLEKKAKGERVLSLAIGEPSFNTPEDIVEEAHRSMLRGEVHYTSSYGLPELRKAMADKARRKNGIRADAAHTIFITTKLAVYASLMAVSDEPFDVLIPDPGYFYAEPALLTGGRPIRYKLAEDFSLDIDAIRRKITPRTRAIIINTPSNPTAKVLKRAELEELYQLCASLRISLISDEAYEDIIFEGEHFSVGSLEHEPELVISLYSFSKSYAMTGWRAGYIVASRAIIERIARFLEHTMTCFPPFIQRACAYALANGEGHIKRFRERLAARRRLLLEKLEGVKGLRLNPIEGAFYAFPEYTAKVPAQELVKRLLLEEGVAVLPGTAFGPSGERHIRLSFSGEEREIEEGAERIRSFFSRLS
jgi:aspartate aminotransferase